MSDVELTSQSSDESTRSSSLGIDGENKPVTEPLVAAFEAGRYFNRLSFHLQQAWFFASDYHAQQVLSAVKGLCRVQLLLIPVLQRDQTRREVLQLIEGLLNGSACDSHWVDLFAADEVLREKDRTEAY
jgi:hypothetical protein